MGIQCQIELSVPSVLCSFLSEYRNLLAVSTKGLLAGIDDNEGGEPRADDHGDDDDDDD